MKLLHITNVDTTGGTNTNCLRVLETPSAQHHLAILDEPGEMEPRWRRTGVALEYLRVLRGSRAGFVRGVAAAVERVQPDAVVLWCCIRIPLVRYALRNSRVRLGVHLGNPNPGGWLREGLLRAQDRAWPSGVATRLFSCSRHVHRSFDGGFWRRFENRVIYNPIARPDATVPRAAIPGDVPCLGMIARLDRIKDHATILRAIALLRTNQVRVRVEFAGDGPLRMELESLAERLGVRDAVEFLGYVDPVSERMRQWTLFVYSTTAREGLGNAVIEALAAGLPCVVSDLPMMREIDGDTDIMKFFPAGDPAGCAVQIRLALSDELLRQRAAEAGPRHVLARHDPAAYGAQVAEFILG